MKERSLNREILRLAIPSILANMTVPLVGLADIAITGHLGDIAVKDGLQAASLIGGITIGQMIFDLLYWSLSFLRTGTGGLTAQSYGRSLPTGDFREAGSILLRSLALCLVFSLVMILIQVPFLKLSFMVVDCSEEVRILASQYFRIRIWAAPATLSLFAFKGWYIGMQDTVTPMLSDLIVNVLNVAASIFLAFGAWGYSGMGYDGVALGTVIAQWTGFAFVVAVLLFRYRRKVFGSFTKEDLRALFRDRAALGGFFSLNNALFIRSLGLIAVYVGFTTLSARYGDTLLSVAAIIMELLLIFSYFTDGFAYAGEAMTGKYIGLGDQERLRGTIRGTFAWSMGIALLFVGIYALAGTPLLRMMTSDAGVIAATLPYMPWLLVMPLIGCPAFTWDGIFIGATASKPLRNAAVFSAVGFFLAWFAGTALLQYALFGTVSLDGRTLADAAGALANSADSLAVAPALADAAGQSAALPRYGELAIHVLLGAYFVHLVIRTAYQSAVARRSVRL